MLRFVKPSLEYEKTIKNYRSAFLKNNEKIHGGCALDKYDNIDEWIEFTKFMQTEKAEKLGCVPSETYLCIRAEDNKMVGIVNIRKYLNDSIKVYGGHIGYSVLPDERKKGYATQILSMALEKCRTLGLNSVLVTCDKDNTASQKVIIKNGGKLENIIERTKRFWIDLEEL